MSCQVNFYDGCLGRLLLCYCLILFSEHTHTHTHYTLHTLHTHTCTCQCAVKKVTRLISSSISLLALHWVSSYGKYPHNHLQQMWWQLILDTRMRTNLFIQDGWVGDPFSSYGRKYAHHACREMELAGTTAIQTLTTQWGLAFTKSLSKGCELTM